MTCAVARVGLRRMHRYVSSVVCTRCAWLECLSFLVLCNWSLVAVSAWACESLRLLTLCGYVPFSQHSDETGDCEVGTSACGRDCGQVCCDTCFSAEAEIAPEGYLWGPPPPMLTQRSSRSPPKAPQGKGVGPARESLLFHAHSSIYRRGGRYLFEKLSTRNLANWKHTEQTDPHAPPLPDLKLFLAYLSVHVRAAAWNKTESRDSHADEDLGRSSHARTSLRHRQLAPHWFARQKEWKSFEEHIKWCPGVLDVRPNIAAPMLKIRNSSRRKTARHDPRATDGRTAAKDIQDKANCSPPIQDPCTGDGRTAAEKADRSKHLRQTEQTDNRAGAGQAATQESQVRAENLPHAHRRDDNANRLGPGRRQIRQTDPGAKAGPAGRQTVQHDFHAEDKRSREDRSEPVRRQTERHDLRSARPQSFRKDVQDESVERPGPATRHIAQQEAEDDLKPQRSAPGQQPQLRVS